jgi:hypothetical protein
MPEAVSGFRLKKSDEDLGKYDKSDDRGRYKWDTYIRKQARQFYPIKCPDGSILERDECGKPISWLWSKDTFVKKYAEGEVKFEKSEKKGWRLFYKDRLQDLEKILRSIVTSQSPLCDFVEGKDSRKAGNIFLTKSGDDEVKDYPGQDRPSFLKSSEYYKFIATTFGESGSIYIPFSENGSALVACLSEELEGREVTIGGASYSREFVEWRVNKAGFVSASEPEWSLNQGSKVDLLRLKDLGEEETRRFIKSLRPKVTEWHDLFVEAGEFSVSSDGAVVLVMELADIERKVDFHAIFGAAGIEPNGLKEVVSLYSCSLLRGLLSLPDNVKVEQLPASLIK